MVTVSFCDKYGTFFVENVSAVLNIGASSYEVYFINGDKETYEDVELISMELE